MVTLQAGRRITLPKDMCERVGFSPGDDLVVELAEFSGALRVRKKTKVIEGEAHKKKASGLLTARRGAPKE